MKPTIAKNALAALVLMTLNACASLKTAVHTTWDAQPSHRVAVLPFKGDYKFSEELADSLITELVDHGFVVLERSELTKIINEHRLQYTGAFDPVTLIDSGKLAGVDFIVLGSVSTRDVVPPMEWLLGNGQSVRQVDTVNVRWVSVRSGQVVASSRFRNARGGRLETIATRIVDSVTGAVQARAESAPIERQARVETDKPSPFLAYRGLN